MAEKKSAKADATPKGASGGIYKKLLKVQEEVSPVVKDKVNPHFHHKYADINQMIESVKPILTKHGLVLLQPLTTVGSGAPAVRTILIDSETDEKIEDVTPIVGEVRNAQQHGSAVTYFRRYALQSMLFLQTEDDDGNIASQTPVRTAPARQKPIAVKPDVVQDSGMTDVKMSITKSMKIIEPQVTKDTIHQLVSEHTGLDLVEENYHEIDARLSILVEERNLTQ